MCFMPTASENVTFSESGLHFKAAVYMVTSAKPFKQKQSEAFLGCFG